jgi:hypothetical protein
VPAEMTYVISTRAGIFSRPRLREAVASASCGGGRSLSHDQQSLASTSSGCGTRNDSADEPMSVARPAADGSLADSPAGVRVWFASDDARRLLDGNGLATFSEIFNRGEPLTGREARRGSRHAHKGVSTATVHDGTRQEMMYIKKQWKWSRLLPRIRDWRRRTVFVTTPALEWRGLGLLREAGLCPAERLALFTANGFSPHAAVITRAVPAPDSLHDLIVEGRFAQLSSQGRSTLASAIVSVIRQIHAAGLGWGSMEAWHFYPRRMPDSRWQIWLIDGEGVHRLTSRGEIGSDRAKFLNSLARCHPDEGWMRLIESGLQVRREAR